MRVFISSTVRDLAQHREAVFRAIRRLGHQSDALEDWAASDQAPLDRSLEAVRDSDVFVLLVAWRYGWIPPGQVKSTSELELETARARGLPCLIFLVPDDAPWPVAQFDEDRTNIDRFRHSLLERHVVAFFTTPDVLAKQVAVALHAWTARHTSVPIAEAPDAVVSVQAPSAEVFVSYAHEDVAVAEAISTRLTKEGWSVFWDRTIPVGLIWDDYIEAALDDARCVVVLWSPASTQSKWVRLEAMEGEERGILAPGLVAETKIPLRFRRIQTADLVRWSEDSTDTPGITSLVLAVGRCVKSRGAA